MQITDPALTGRPNFPSARGSPVCRPASERQLGFLDAAAPAAQPRMGRPERRAQTACAAARDGPRLIRSTISAPTMQSPPEIIDAIV